MEIYLVATEEWELLHTKTVRAERRLYTPSYVKIDKKRAITYKELLCFKCNINDRKWSAYRKKSWNYNPHPIKRTLIPILACSHMPRLCLFFPLISLTVIFSGKPGVLFNEPLSSQMHSMPGNLWEVGCNWWDRPWEHSKAHFWKVIKGSCLSVKALLALALFDSLDNCPSFLKSKRRKTDGRWRIEWWGGTETDAWHSLKHSCRL